MTQKLDPRYRSVRICYRLFYILGFPLFLFALFLLTVLGILQIWPMREGPIEGPEPSEAAVLCNIVGISVFVVVYIAVWLLASRIQNPQRAWIPFAVQIPALAFLSVLYGGWFADSRNERFYFALYPGILLLTLIAGIICSLGVAARIPEIKEPVNNL